MASLKRDSTMKQRPQVVTPIQNVALNQIFAVMGEERINRSIDEYMDVVARLPPLKVLKHKVDERLQHLHDCSGCNGFLLPKICRFKAGDQIISYEPYPTEISRETIRVALEIAGMRKPRWRKRKA